jgi:hypothetical protein
VCVCVCVMCLWLPLTPASQQVFNCPHCAKGFPVHANLKRHLVSRASHAHTPTPPHLTNNTAHTPVTDTRHHTHRTHWLQGRFANLQSLSHIHAYMYTRTSTSSSTCIPLAQQDPPSGVEWCSPLCSVLWTRFSTGHRLIAGAIAGECAQCEEDRTASTGGLFWLLLLLFSV